MDEYRIKNDIEEYLRNCLPEQFYQYAADRVYEIFEPAGYRKDMALKVLMQQAGAKIFTVERGIETYSVYSDREEDVIFAVLDYLISIMAEHAVWDQLADKKNGRLYYSDEVKAYRDTFKNEAFKKTGTPYSKWHQQGYTWLRLPPHE